jgi:hypothetical protein
MNRLKYDQCAYNSALHQSTAPIGYVLDPVRYYNPNRCRPTGGIVGGTAVSHATHSLVDLENDLRGQTRPATQCWQYQYMPRADGYMVSREYIKPVQHPKLNTADVYHMPTCRRW